VKGTMLPPRGGSRIKLCGQIMVAAVGYDGLWLWSGLASATVQHVDIWIVEKISGDK
jgi:hypothetical protein